MGNIGYDYNATVQHVKAALALEDAQHCLSTTSAHSSDLRREAQVKTVKQQH